MSDKWDYAEKTAKEADEGGIFLRLKEDGDKAIVAFVGDPEVSKVVWNGSQYEDYDERKHDKSPSVRFKINVFNVKHNCMQMWECSAQTFKGVVQVKSKYGLDKMTFEICRQGAKGDTNTTYSILPEDHITDELRERISNEKLHDLLADYRKEGKSKKSEADKGNGIDDDIAKLIGRLKNLDAKDVKTFLAKFEIEKVKELKKEQLKQASAFIEQLEGKNKESDEVDPFA